MEKIAVFLKENGEIGSFTESKCVNIFVSEYGDWLIKKKLNLDLHNINNMKAIREAFLKLISEMEDCRIVVVNKAFGIPYSVFYAEDFSVWELEGKVGDILDSILIKEKEHEILEEKKKEEEEFAVKIDEGHYLIDLIKLQLLNPEISSKKAIIPFIKTRDFNKLDIKCCHVPPWIKNESEKNNLSMKIKEISKDDYQVTLGNL